MLALRTVGFYRTCIWNLHGHAWVYKGYQDEILGKEGHALIFMSRISWNPQKRH